MTSKLNEMISLLEELRDSKEDFFHLKNVFSLSEDFLKVAIYLIINEVNKEFFISVVESLWDTLDEHKATAGAQRVPTAKA